MIPKISSLWISVRIWLTASLVFGAGTVCVILTQDPAYFFMGFLAAIPAALGSIPVMIGLIITFPMIRKLVVFKQAQIAALLAFCLVCTLPYAAVWGAVMGFGADYMNLPQVVIVSAALTACLWIAIFIRRNQVTWYFNVTSFNYITNQSTQMETSQVPQTPWDSSSGHRSVANKTLIKGIITGVLILVMLIPTVYIANLVQERQERQQTIAHEVSGKWAAAQTLSGPYIFLPYKIYTHDKEGKIWETDKHLLLLPDEANVTADITHEIRKRSIYNVLLYRAHVTDAGQFIFTLPKDILPSAVQWTETRICYGLSDVKGIEEKLSISVNGSSYELAPGLPANDVSEKGLSAPMNLTADDLGKRLAFAIDLKLKGSEELHFLPLGGNSAFTARSTWPNPSFDGNNLPTERTVTESGFSAKWTFNKANLPFGITLRDAKLDDEALAFGITMLQPADQYAKTARSVKYAILFIGLTFSLFFIIELTQKKPVHPVQYILIGLALVIFYTLLLAISEFIFFDLSYLIAAGSTITLITAYAQMHFRSWKSASLFGGVLSALYGFIFILIRLEDTALLVGSIGLFVVLALVMFGSRKVNWYGEPVGPTETIPQ